MRSKTLMLFSAVMVFTISGLAIVKMMGINVNMRTPDHLICTQEDLTRFHTDPATWNNMANYCIEWGDYSAAEKEFSLLIQTYPNFGIAYMNRGRLYEKMQRFPEAIKDYQAYLNLLNSFPCNDKKCIEAKEATADRILSIQDKLHSQ